MAARNLARPWRGSVRALGFVLLMLCFAGGARAEAPPVIVRLAYAGFTPHLHAVSLETELLLAPSGYRIVMTGHTTGMVGFFYHADWRSWSDGLWRDSGVAPLHFETTGVFAGQRRHVMIDFVGGDPILRALEPPDDGEHLPFDPALTHHTIDTLALTMLVIRQTALLGHCEGEARTFDGRQTLTVALHAVGAEDLAPTSRSSWRGPTLRCDLAARVTSGFLRDASSPAARAFTDTTWMGTLFPGLPPLPVRFTVTTHHLGTMMMYLTAASRLAPGRSTTGYTPEQR